MRVHVLFAQRVENYNGEFAPEALEIATEFQTDENEDLLGLLQDEHEPQVGKEFVAIKWVQFDVDAAKIRSLLIGNPLITARLVP